jgi:fibronectin type 3 domain-containing protein
MTYVRAEVRKTAPSGTIVGLTEPIAFRTVAGLPSDLSMHVDSVTPASGCQCSLLQTKGIASTPTWNGTSKTLTLALTNPAQATVELLGTSGTAPSSVSMDGTAVAASTSLSAFQSATGDAWYYDAASGALYLQDLQGTANSTVVVGFGGTTDSTPPSIPTGLTATGVSSSEVDLKWTASSDTGGSGLAGYNVFRGTQKLNGAPVTGTTFADTGLNASTAYTYTVTAVDNAGNQSDPSAPATGTTLAGSAGTGTFTAVADAYVDSSAASTNYGTRTTLRVDTSPTVRSYLRFTVSGLSGTVSSVQLKVHANTGLSAGFAVDALTDDTWKESTITYASAPAPGSQIAKSGAVTSGTDVTVTLPPSSVSGNGDVNLVLAGLSSTALSLGSRESATKPQLIVTTSAGGGGGDTTPPSAPTGLKASGVSSSEIDLSWTASTDDSGVVAGYNVYEGTVKVNSTLVAGTSFNVTGLAAGSQHTYTVTAVDGSHNESANSGSATATTLQAADTTKPNTPTGLAANPVSATEVDLTWNTAQDNAGGSGIKGYNVYRDGTKITGTPVAATSYADRTTSGGTTYQYAVSSVDNAGNESVVSATVPATTPSGGGGGGTFTFSPTADAYVDSSVPTTSYGTSAKLRVDGSPTVNSFLRFTLSGVTGTVTSVTLKVYATSSLAAGFAVDAVADNTWTEAITYDSEPTIGGLIANSSAAVTGSYVTVTLPVTAVPTSGDVSFALTPRSTTALALASRESTTPPQLVVTTS